MHFKGLIISSSVPVPAITSSAAPSDHELSKFLSSGIVPDSFKTSLLLPLLKKPNLDPNGLNNYRPIANLPFLDKVLERIVAAQLKAHLETFGMLPVY